MHAIRRTAECSHISPALVTTATPTPPLDLILYHPQVASTYLAIPKVGCSTLKRWFIAQVSPHELERPDIDVHKYAEAHLTMSRTDPSTCKAILANHPLIAFWRPESDRLRSAFVEKFVRPSPDCLFEPGVRLLKQLGRTPQQGLRFREFVQHICRSSPSDLDLHWRPQSAILATCQPSQLLPLSLMTHLLAESGRHPLSAHPSNVTRKEPAHIQNAADMLSVVLHARNLRPTVDDLVDAQIAHMLKSIEIIRSACD